MKVSQQPRIYEWRNGVWIEQPAAVRRPRKLLRDVAALMASVFAIAMIAAVGLIAACLAIVLLPLALFAAWRLRAAMPKQGN